MFHRVSPLQSVDAMKQTTSVYTIFVFFLHAVCETTIKGFKDGFIKKENVILGGWGKWGKVPGEVISVTNSLSQRRIIVDFTRGDTAKLQTIVKVSIRKSRYERIAAFGDRRRKDRGRGKAWLREML